MAPLELEGSTFGFWTVIGKSLRKGKRRYWICQCVCGIKREVDGSNLKNSVSRSCGCVKSPHTSTQSHKDAAAKNSREAASRKQEKQLLNYLISEKGCWEWQGSVDKDGYGKAKRDGKTIRSHRLFYESHVGEIPSGMLVLHKCDNPACVNPMHLYIGTQIENERDKDSRGRRKNAYGPC